MDGWKKSEAAEIFQISRNTIDLWLKRREKTEDHQSGSNRPHHIHAKITDWKQFQEFVQRYGDKTQEEIALLWHEPISARTISRRLKKIEFTQKKRVMDINRETKSKESNLPLN